MLWRRDLLNRLLLATCLVCSGPAHTGSDAGTDEDADEWFDEPEVIQLSAGELVFLSTQPDSKTPHSQNSITITTTSLADRWVQIKQCYQGLDAVPDAEVVYQYRNMRALRVDSHSGIGRAVVQGKSVQLADVRHAATLCIRAEAQILYDTADGRLVLRNGPFHRKFLDGYFPLHVTLEVHFPARLLRYLGTSPRPQPGFEVQATHGKLSIDTWFAGSLGVEMYFSHVAAEQQKKGRDDR